MNIMKYSRHILFATILLCCIMPSKAQFTEIDWAQYSSDTLLPRYSQMVELGDDYALYNYTVAIEYPEFQIMSADEVRRYNLGCMRDSLPSYPQAEATVGVSAKRGQLDVNFIPVVYRDGKFQRINSFKLAIRRTSDIHSVIKRVASNVATADRTVKNSVLSTGRWVKIAVPERGVYKITDAELRKMGFKNPAKVRLFGYGGRILPEKNIHLLPDDLCEVPLWRGDGRVLFYAEGTIRWSYEIGRFVHRQNVYSEYSCYFLNEGDADPIPFPKKEVSPTSEQVYTTYPDYALYEKEQKSLSTYGRILLDGYDYATGRSAKYNFDIEGMTAERATVDISFGSNATSFSRVAVEVDGEQVGSLSIDKASSSDHGRIAQSTFAVSSGFSDNPTIKLTHTVQETSLSGFLDFVRLNFVRSLALYSSSTNFRGNAVGGNATFKIASATANTHVWRVTEASETEELVSTFADGTLTVVAPASRNEELVAVDVSASFPSVTVLGEVPNQNLHALGQTDMVIIIPSNNQWRSAAERLAEAHRVHDALTVAVVTAEQVYNEFSSGTPDATAYRRLMKMLYDRAASPLDAPRYLLLFGDGLTDNRLITYPRRRQEDFLLTYQSENSVSAVRSYVLEDYYGFLDDDEGSSFLRDKMDVSVGRLPVQAASEANAVVDKIIGYMENKAAGSWQNMIVLMGDDGDKNSHMQDAENVAKILETGYPSYMIDRIYWDNYPMEVLATGDSYPMVTETIYKRLDEGALIVNYSGHGSANLFSHELAWSAADMAAISSPRIPFWVTASCDIGPFDMGDNSLAETAMLNPNGAAIGLLTTTRTVLQSYNATINQQFMRRLMAPAADGEQIAVGDAVRLAKCDIITSGGDLSENKLQYVLIGDPALRLKMPQYKVVVEKFNGQDAKIEGKVSAGGRVTVEGYVALPDGTLHAGFTGFVSPTLFDCVEEVTTRNNKKADTEPFNYTTYSKRLFTGTDSVKNGRFSLTMPVPLDISYRNLQGMLNLFAIDTLGNSAQGTYGNFTVGGTSSAMDNDGSGPQITMYLNTPEFKDGDEVNSTPCLFVEIFDESGINTVGTGIGHDIIAMVDNDNNRTYNLNDIFEPMLGDYRRGTAMQPIDELSEGEHTLVLRAWDLFNNSSTDTLRFTVVKGLAPELVDVSVAPNPVRYGEKALFAVAHNRPHSELDITVEVFNLQGQLLWKHRESSGSGSALYTIEWNVTTSGGQPLPTGVYIYRATLSADGSTERTKSRKIIVLNNK